jgi:hypothetical protein
VFNFEQKLGLRKCFNSCMASKAENPGMWVRLTPIRHGGGHHEGYGEAQSTRNSRFLQLADVILSNPTPVIGKARAVAAVQVIQIPRQNKH